MPRRITPGGPFLVSSPRFSSTSVIDDGADSWWSNANLSAIPLAIAAASLAASVGATQQINQHNDEIVPYIPSQAVASQPYGQRLRHTTLFLKWGATDELPFAPPAAFDDDGWRPPVVVLSPPIAPLSVDSEFAIATVFEADIWQGSWRAPEVVIYIPGLNEDFVPAPAAFVPDEDYQFAPLPQLVAAQSAAPVANDEVGTPAATLVEEVDGFLPLPPVLAAVPQAASGDDDLPITAAPAIVEEDYWFQEQAKIEPARGYTLVADEEVVPAISTEEGEWQQPFPPIPAPQFFNLVGSEDEIVPPPVPLQVEDEYDTGPMLAVKAVAPVIALFGGDEEMGDFVPPPVVEDRKDGAKWPLKVRQYLTKIKDRFYWFSDESELPKEEAKPVQAPAIAKVDAPQPAAPETTIAKSAGKIAADISEKSEADARAEIAKREQIARNNEAILKLMI